METFNKLAKYNPSLEFIDGLRLINVIVGLVACLCLFVFLFRPRWKEWNIPTRMGWLALFFLCLSVSYGSFEVRYLDTFLRVPMVTVSLIWAVVAALWPRDKTELWSRKK